MAATRLLILMVALPCAWGHVLNPEIGLTDFEKEEFLRLHNEARREEGSSNMFELEWDEHLAIVAFRWANQCNFTHGFVDNDYGDSEIGQNLYVKEGETNKFGGVKSWINEKKFYDYDTGVCRSPPCGHYTQASWANSYKIGCAYARCPRLFWPAQNKYLIDANNIVCHYWPGGNIAGVTPFRKGEACSECSNGKGWCKNGLCQSFCESKGPDCSCPGLACENCGETDPDTCTCKCKKGFQGMWCGDVCRNTDPKCENYQLVHCRHQQHGALITKLCPLKCGVCEYVEDRSWTCKGKTWDDVFGVVDATASRDDQGCIYPFVYGSRYHDSCVEHPQHGSVCSLTLNLDLYKSYKPCALVRTIGGTGGGAACHFPYYYRGRKRYNCLDWQHGKWCGTTRNYDRDRLWGSCLPPDQGA